MKGVVIAVVLGLCCAVALAQTGESGGIDATAASQSMYEAADVVGVLINTNEMYQDGDISWYSGRLRIDEVPESRSPKVGQIVRLSYAMPTGMKAPGIGDQVRGSIYRRPVEGKKAPVWMAAQPLEVLGRGDFIRPGEQPVVDMGSKKARILVKMLAPLHPDCHKKTGQLVSELVEREPERVRFQAFNMSLPAGREEINREGLSCATVLVNNRYEFTLIDPDGAERKVSLSRRPNDPNSSYRSEDVVAIVEQELKRLYP
jgi:hypothetical protein